MLNIVSLTGRLTKDIDLRYTQSGTAVASFTLAVDRQYTNAAGERESDFISCVIWRKSAENLSNFTRKGSLIGVEGTIQTRNYDNAQGQRVYVTEVVVNNFALLESKAAAESRLGSNGGQQQGNGWGQQQHQPNQQQQGQRQSHQSNYNQQGTQNRQQQAPARNQQPSAGNDPFAGKSINIDDNQLPF